MGGFLAKLITLNYRDWAFFAALAGVCKHTRTYVKAFFE